MKKRFMAIMFILALPVFTSAAPVEFVKEYTYDAGEADSLLTCRTVSLLQVKRLLLEELGTYLESNTEIVNYELQKDQITVLTAGIVKTDIIDEKWNGKKYWLKAKMESDPQAVVESIDKLKKNNEIDKKVNELSEEYDAAFERIEELKEQLADAQRNVVRLNQDYQDAQKFIMAAKSLERGIQLRKDNKIQEAFDAFNSGIEMNPSYGLYLERAKTYIKTKQYNRAIHDLDTAIQLKPEYAKAYFQKGIALCKKGQKKRGIRYVQKAAQMGNRAAKLWLKTKKKQLK